MEERTVYRVNDKDIYGTDFFGNEIFYGDDIYFHNDEFWLIEDLEASEIALLEHFGAKKSIAKEKPTDNNQ
ncbi:hypothetical protein [Paraliobacillus salinarum]|uniref:hypothetical protein n=1 Tax=Paraliobacillus salinarum TaxID=1158996 RepID=UPI0015F700EB|nr:hypothetical protein [Paraliobacillus salinarum]